VSAAPRNEAHADPDADPTVVYSVADNGLGIPDSYQGKIFTAFQRLHGDVAKGEGIGLALVRRMVERNGGRVWFVSKAGRGSTFSFSMPAKPKSSAESPSRGDPDSAGTQRRKEIA